MSDIKEFEVATKPKVQPGEEDKGTQFRVPDLMTDPDAEQTFATLTAYQPDEGQFAMLMAMTGRGASDADRIAGIINFFVNVIDERGADYLQSRLLTPTRIDPFGIDQVEIIMKWLTRVWTGNPTQEPSGSTPSPLTDGPKSTEGRLLI